MILSPPRPIAIPINKHDFVSQENKWHYYLPASVSERSDHQVNINVLCHIKKHVHMVQWVVSPRRLYVVTWLRWFYFIFLINFLKENDLYDWNCNACTFSIHSWTRKYYNLEDSLCKLTWIDFPNTTWFRITQSAPGPTAHWA